MAQMHSLSTFLSILNPSNFIRIFLLCLLKMCSQGLTILFNIDSILFRSFSLFQSCFTNQVYQLGPKSICARLYFGYACQFAHQLSTNISIRAILKPHVKLIPVVSKNPTLVLYYSKQKSNLQYNNSVYMAETTSRQQKQQTKGDNRQRHNRRGQWGNMNQKKLAENFLYFRTITYYRK